MRWRSVWRSPELLWPIHPLVVKVIRAVVRLLLARERWSSSPGAHVHLVGHGSGMRSKVVHWRTTTTATAETWSRLLLLLGWERLLRIVGRSHHRRSGTIVWEWRTAKVASLLHVVRMKVGPHAPRRSSTRWPVHHLRGSRHPIVHHGHGARARGSLPLLWMMEIRMSVHWVKVLVRIELVIVPKATATIEAPSATERGTTTTSTSAAPLKALSLVPTARELIVVLLLLLLLQ